MITTLFLTRYLMPVLYSFYGHREPPAGAGDGPLDLHPRHHPDLRSCSTRLSAAARPARTRPRGGPPQAFGVPTGGWMPKGFLTEDGPRPEFAEQYGAAEMPTDSDTRSDRTERPGLRRDPLVRRDDDLGRSGDGRGVSQVRQAVHAGLPGRVVRAVARRRVDRRERDQNAERGRQPRGRGARDRGSGGTVPRPRVATARPRTSLIPGPLAAGTGRQ